MVLHKRATSLRKRIYFNLSLKIFSWSVKFHKNCSREFCKCLLRPLWDLWFLYGRKPSATPRIPTNVKIAIAIHKSVSPVGSPVVLFPSSATNGLLPLVLFSSAGGAALVVDNVLVHSGTLALVFIELLLKFAGPLINK